MVRPLLPLFLFVYFTTLQAQQKAPINFYLTPSISNDILKKNGTYIRNFLEKETGISINLVVPASYDELVNAFGTEGSSFAIMSSQSYVLANQKYGAQVKLRTVRFGHSVYYGMIITRTGSGIKTVRDLSGKSIAYSDKLSTSGYLFAKKLLEKNKVISSKEIFAKTHDEVVRLVYEGKADAGAAFYSPPSSNGEIRDARARLLTKYSDVAQKVTILAKTEPIPNDPIVFSRNFNPESARILYTALVKLSTDAKGKEILLDLYGTEGFVKASDADYNSLRQVMTSVK